MLIIRISRNADVLHMVCEWT